MSGFNEIIVGDVLLAPFVGYAGVALVLFLLLRIGLQFIGMERMFANVPAAEFSLFVIILSVLFAIS